MILGRQPALGMAELESLYGPDKLRPVGQYSALLDVDPCLVAFNRLGGSIKFCKLLTVLDTTNWKEIEKYLLKVSPEHSRRMPEGKMQLGLSVLGLDVNLRQLEVTGLSIKKAIKKTGRNVRLVPNKELELNSASVLHNRLTGPAGWELVFVRDGDKTLLAQTIKVQDIDSYSLRDRGRPKRDAKVGMLPPKLAQIIINLAVGQLSEDSLASICEIPAGATITKPKIDQTILDPFCGTGVILQEATLMGYKLYGSDLEPRMVDYTKQNLAWLEQTYGLNPKVHNLEVGDATNHNWPLRIDFVASEIYLGRPFTSPPRPEILVQTAADCNLILKKFLRNIAPQIEPGTRLCFAVPAWQAQAGQFKHLPVLDQIEEIGYNRVSFEHVRPEELLYYREDQIVARELLVLTRQ